MCFRGHKIIRNLWMTHFFLGYEGISTYFPTLWKPSLHPLNCLPPWRQRGQNKTSKYLQNTLDTNSFPRVTRGGAGRRTRRLRRWCGSASSPAKARNKQRWRNAILTARLWTVRHTHTLKEPDGRRLYEHLSAGHAGIRWNKEMGAHLRGCCYKKGPQTVAFL